MGERGQCQVAEIPKSGPQRSPRARRSHHHQIKAQKGIEINTGVSKHQLLVDRAVT